MLRKLMASLATVAVAFFAATGFAFAAVDVNNADQAQLESIKGIGPAISAKIIAERKKGNFKDWADLETRVSGIGDKNSSKLSEGGLTVGGQAKANAPAMAQPATTKTTKKSDTTSATAPASADTSSKTTVTKSKTDAMTPAPAMTKSTTTATKSDAMADTKSTKTTSTKKDGKADSATVVTETKPMTKSTNTSTKTSTKADGDTATTETKTTKSKSKKGSADATSTDSATTTTKK